MILVLTVACVEDIPSTFDGSFDVEITTVYEDSVVTDINVTISTTDYQVDDYSAVSDSTGKVVFTDLPFAEYRVRGEGDVILPDLLDPTMLDTQMVSDTALYVNPDLGINSGGTTVVIADLPLVLTGSEPGLKINEVYTVGPPNNFYYFYDQYFELYNSSSDTIYLDGMIFCRMGKFTINVTYIFQLPGTPLTGREYPIAPGEFKVLAGDAYDHRLIVPGSIDLSDADFEFHNSLDYGDWDNPDVPNIDNLEVGHRLDFMVGLTGDVVLIADGSDVDYLDGIDIDSVIDCVEFSSSSTHTKEIEKELDRSYGGIGQIKYSGSSLERRYPGFDSNSSGDDFVIISAPTIGYHHETD